MADAARCGDCDVIEGQVHEFGCDLESCPFCLGQLISCDCLYDKLGLVDPSRYGEETEHLPPGIYKNGISEEEEARWLEILTAKGRVPFINYPLLCARCGVLWPELFMVPDAEWEYYIQEDKRGEILCEPCYRTICRLIDTQRAPRRNKSRKENSR